MKNIYSKTDYSTVKVFDVFGNVIQEDKGYSTYERFEHHEHGSCDAFCPFCWEEAMKFLKDNANKIL